MPLNDPTTDDEHQIWVSRRDEQASKKERWRWENPNFRVEDILDEWGGAVKRVRFPDAQITSERIQVALRWLGVELGYNVLAGTKLVRFGKPYRRNESEIDDDDDELEPPEIEKDETSGAPMPVFDFPEGWVSWTDVIASSVWANLELACRWQANAKTREFRYWKMALTEFHNRMDALFTDAEVTIRFNPIRDYFDSLPRGPVPEFRNSLPPLMKDVFEIENNSLNRFACEYPFQAVIESAYDLNWHSHLMVVLAGAQGVGKTTCWNNLLPLAKDGSSMTAAIGINWDDAREYAQAQQGKVLVEVPELAELTRSHNLERVKQLITQEKYVGRMPYDRHASTIPLRAVMVGTTNSFNPLPNDPTGNRRFVILRVKPGGCQTGKEVADYLRENRDRIWQHELWKYRQRGDNSSYDFGIPFHLTDEQRQSNLEQRAISTEQEELEDLLEDLEEFGVVETTSRGLVGASPYPLDNFHKGGRGISHSAAQAFMTRGWVKKRVTRNDKRVKVWQSPLYESTENPATVEEFVAGGMLDDPEELTFDEFLGDPSQPNDRAN